MGKTKKYRNKFNHDMYESNNYKRIRQKDLETGNIDLSDPKFWEEIIIESDNDELIKKVAKNHINKN